MAFKSAKQGIKEGILLLAYVAGAGSGERTTRDKLRKKFLKKIRSKSEGFWGLS